MRKQRQTQILLGAAALAVVCLGCAGSGTAPPKRHGIISMGPQITETVYALGEGSRLVGVTDFCDYPPAAAKLPKVGGFINPDYEKITMLHPALIILSGEDLEMSRFCRKSGIPYISVYMDSLATIDQGIAIIGKALGVEARATALREKIKAELDAVRKSVAGKPRPKVLILTGRSDHNLDALYTVGGKSFVSQIVEVAGGDNIYENAPRPYFEASKETVVLKAPDAIIEFHPGEHLTKADKAQFIADWNKLPSLPAVKHHRILIVTDSYALRPGPRIPQIARQIANFLHPPAQP